MIINVVSSPKGGGAELLVRELHLIYTRRNIDSIGVFLSGDSEILGVNEIVLGGSPRHPFNIFRLRKLFKEKSAESGGELIVHVHLTWPFFYAVLSSFGIPNIKLIYTEHSTTNRRRKIPLFWLVERFFYARYYKIICISQGVHDALSEWIGEKQSHKLVTIPNGSRIYSMGKRSNLQGRLPRLVSIGSLSSKKNFATAIRAVGYLKGEIESYTIIGEGPVRSRLEGLIKSENLEKEVQLIGWSDSIESQLHAADIQLIPSLWEGFGLVAVEGMSTGLPVVASNVDGLREVLDEANPSVTFVSQAESVDQWVAAIRKSISDLDEFGADFLANSSGRQAANFTLDLMAERYLDLYRGE